MCFYIPHAPDLSVPDDRLGLVAPPTLCDRSDLVQRLYAPRASQPLPSFLQQLGLEAGHDVPGAGPLGHPRARAYRDRRVGRRRHALPQTWFDDLRHGHASRSTYLESGQALDQLGARLGGRDLDHPQPALGPDQGMEFAVDLLLVPQPSRRHQRQKESPARGREEEAVRFAFPSDPPGNRRGTGFSAGRLVSATTVHAHRRQCLWRAECAEEIAAQRGPDQPCASQRVDVRTGPARSERTKGMSSGRKENAFPGWCSGQRTRASPGRR